MIKKWSPEPPHTDVAAYGKFRRLWAFPQFAESGRESCAIRRSHLRTIARTWRFTSWKIISRRIASAPEFPKGKWIFFWARAADPKLLGTSILNALRILRRHSPVKHFFMLRCVSFSPASTRERSGGRSIERAPFASASRPREPLRNEN